MFTSHTISVNDEIHLLRSSNVTTSKQVRFNLIYLNFTGSLYLHMVHKRYFILYRGKLSRGPIFILEYHYVHTWNSLTIPFHSVPFHSRSIPQKCSSAHSHYLFHADVHVCRVVIVYTWPCPLNMDLAIDNS